MGAGQNYGNQVAQNHMGMGNAAAASHIAQSNQMTGLIGQGMQAYGAYSSDERVKTNIQPVSKADLKEMRSKLKAYFFNYIDQDTDGQGEWVGVMAQDLEQSRLGRTLITTDERGVKQIDMRKAMSMLLATMAEA
jgi:hypothetical protein